MSRSAPLLLVLLVAAACSGGGGGSGGGASVSASKGESLVLARSDVGHEFTQFDTGKQLKTDFSPPRDDPNRFGRKNGWKARFSRPGGRKTKGPLVVASLADLFGSSSGAHDDFKLYQQTLAQFAATGGKTLSVSGLGNESDAVTFRQGLPPNAVRYYVIAWRDGNVTASVNVNGFDGKLTEQQALDFAQKQEKRIRAAAG